MSYKICLIVFFCFATSVTYPLNAFERDTIVTPEVTYPDQQPFSDTSTISNHFFVSQKSYEEAYLLFSYKGIIRSTITAFYDGSFYLPLKEIFEELLINYQFDREAEVITGFYINPNDEYKIDFRMLSFKKSDVEFQFNKDDLIITELDYYLKIDFFSRAFNLLFLVDLRSLALNLSSGEILPVYAKFLRGRKYTLLSGASEQEEFPMLFPRERSFFTGGFLDYNISASYAEFNKPFYNYDLGLGTEVFGGDLKTAASGSIAGNNSVNSLFEYRWRYALSKNKYLTEASIGKLIGTGISSYSFEGVQISNQPLEPRESFAKTLIADRTIPGSTIELYLNDQLFDYTETNAAGNFNFWVPITYGSAFVTLKYYSPNGETRTLERYYQTPYVLNPPGEFNYTINVGRLSELDDNYGQASGIYGITDWLSDLVGVEYLNNDLFNKPIFYNSLTTRISSGYLFNILTAPNAFYQISANAVYPSLTAINLSYRKYQTNEIYNPIKIENEISSSINLPIYFDETPLVFQSIGLYQDVNNSNSYDGRLILSKNIESYTPSVTYIFRQFGAERLIFKQAYLSVGLLKTIDLFPEPFNFFRGTLLNTGFNFNLSADELESFFVSIASNITSTIRLQFDYDHNLSYNFTNTRFNIFIDMPFTRSYTTIGKDYFTTSLQGSLLYNQTNNQINFFNREQIGRTVSSFRMFVDDDGNGVYDEGERLINGGKVNLQSANSNIRVEKNETLVRDLNPYTDYKVQVDESKVEEPLYTVKDKLFSFEAGANYVKNIDVPFYSVSEVSGNVSRILDVASSPISGLKVHIEGVDNEQNITVTTFSDGSFYYFGLRPGTFKIYINKEQLEYLNYMAIPGEYFLKIGVIGSEKPFENLNFDLYKK